MFFTLPVDKSSTTITLNPFFSRYSDKFDPIKPAPPVIKMFFIFNKFVIF